MLGHHRHASETSLAGRWWSAFSSIWIISPQLKKKNVVKVGPPLKKNFLEPRMKEDSKILVLGLQEFNGWAKAKLSKQVTIPFQEYLINFIEYFQKMMFWYALNTVSSSIQLLSVNSGIYVTNFLPRPMYRS